MANRKPRSNRLLTVDDVYRQPVGPASHPKSLYALLLRFVRWRRERNWSETTLKTQTHHSYRFICWAAERGLYHAAEVTRPVLESYQRHLYQYRKSNGEPLSSRTQRTTLQPLQVWFSWMAKQGLILANPAADLELPRLEKHLPRTILSVEQVEDIVNLCDLSTLQGIRDRALLELLWSTGIGGARWRCWRLYSPDFNRKILTIVQGKGKVDRVIPVGERALWWLRHYLNGVRPELLVSADCKALFLAMDGVAGLTANGITNAVVPYLRAAGIDKGSCHLFRHAMATQMLENGADLRWIQAMLGHRSVESTQIYTQVSIRALQAVHASTHPAEQGENPEPEVAPEAPDSP
ncbi:site-specific tyrosine recombinase XerC [Serratia symbiotica]|uniref:Site-specific tyrosine recombinase XerC n=1 Tax=Serratia symbiotica TaxID=138074 RepID=A0A068ZA78_9GAMM|nr:site-specific tyrosine recombinase XerC [Serratia symbiotica]MBF1995113.1 site-specific tyrosine recombinase XerC [Serratia symbiotica]MBQ0956335.1 site-specific tyrosine recombinase XerC [Serratia symbiotica]QLH62806.1 site-specific tyrosine recombinase XerC [Serratia symbiotica]QLH62812.1 site-specific tyrosine recombinase XerC [Serratia symbiotica]QTP15494.1 site-specific tyrosine recombinase XerC [Serratia symbiotica]